MSDLAAWPMKINEEYEGIVVHVHGSEHFLHSWEAKELTQAMITAMQGRAVYGEDYQEMALATQEQAKPKPNLLERLGLKRPAQPLKRRPL